MKLMTKELEKQIPKIDPENGSKLAGRRVYAKYFHAFSHWTWYALEYDPDQKLFFGFVQGDFPEYGYFGLQELEKVKVMGLGVERDKHWNNKTTMGEVHQSLRKDGQ
jgi:hypothetical protein